MEEGREMPWNFHTCKFCSYRSKSASIMCKHVRLHRTRSKTDTFLCDLNNPEFFECECCGFVTNLKVDLTEHFRVFHDEKEGNEKMKNILKCLCCKACDFETHSVVVLMKHVDNCDIVFSKENGRMEEVNAVSTTRKDKQSKYRSQKWGKVKCGHCSQEITPKNLKRHITAKHNNPKDIKWMKCAQCAYQCKTKQNLKNHIVTKHVTLEHISWYKCKQCTFKSKLKRYLASHIALQHNSDDISWFKCEQCSYKSKLKGHVKRHTILKHTKTENINWFKCQHCPFVSNYDSTLKTHVLLKHTKPEYINWSKCDQCDYKTKTNRHLKRHIKGKHVNPEDISWFKCDECEYKSKYGYDLKRHVKAKHNSEETWFKCEKCLSYKWKQERSFQLHMLKKHPNKTDVNLKAEKNVS